MKRSCFYLPAHWRQHLRSSSNVSIRILLCDPGSGRHTVLAPSGLFHPLPLISLTFPPQSVPLPSVECGGQSTFTHSLMSSSKSGHWTQPPEAQKMAFSSSYFSPDQAAKYQLCSLFYKTLTSTCIHRMLSKSAQGRVKIFHTVIANRTALSGCWCLLFR